VLSNADMPGFSRMEQARLARIVLAHRGKLGKIQDVGLEGADWKLVFALRTASLILRSRADQRLPFLRVAADDGGFAIDLPQSWLEENPLSADALESEAHHWKTVGMRLAVTGLSDRKVSVLQQVR
jgi:exopolyphosphatase/guanosine-5'-triphosphate,3'-diphosphate pyrophosphatase